MIIKSTELKFTGFHSYADKKSGEPKLLLNCVNDKGFPETKFLDSDPKTLESLQLLTFGDSVVVEEHLNLK